MLCNAAARLYLFYFFLIGLPSVCLMRGKTIQSSGDQVENNKIEQGCDNRNTARPVAAHQISQDQDAVEKSHPFNPDRYQEIQHNLQIRVSQGKCQED